jgi:hypothetical protein
VATTVCFPPTSRVKVEESRVKSLTYTVALTEVEDAGAEVEVPSELVLPQPAKTRRGKSATNSRFFVFILLNKALSVYLPLLKLTSRKA